MKNFIRTKYGRPETKKELLERLKNERNDLEKRKILAEQIKNKNKNEFHFGYYSVNKNMVKFKKLKLDELKKTLKYVDSEILRCENKIETILPINRKVNLGFDCQSKNLSILEPTKEELQDYINELKEKRKEIVLKIEQNKIQISKK